MSSLINISEEEDKQILAGIPLTTDWFLVGIMSAQETVLEIKDELKFTHSSAQANEWIDE